MPEPAPFTPEELTYGEELHAANCGCQRGPTYVWWNMARRILNTPALPKLEENTNG